VSFHLAGASSVNENTHNTVGKKQIALKDVTDPMMRQRKRKRKIKKRGKEETSGSVVNAGKKEGVRGGLSDGIPPRDKRLCKVSCRWGMKI